MVRERLANLVKQTARMLRKEQTEAESVLWRCLKDRKQMGKKILRQHPIVFKWEGRKRFFVADFYCHEARLVIEIDGDVHENRKEHDESREHLINCMGLKVIRYKNKSVLKDLTGTLKDIKKALV
jgi:very-short-patch-repair endonuclease